MAVLVTGGAGFIGSHTAIELINSGKEISKKDLKIGDLIFPSKDHVCIYIGNGKMIHSPKKGDSVKISDIYAFWKARRIL